MIDRFPWLNCCFTAAVIIYTAALSVTGKAAADEAHVTYFNEGVLGANEAKPEPQPVLLATPRLNIVFNRLSTLTFTPSETAATDKLASALDGIMDMHAATLEVTKAPFSLQSMESRQFFNAEELPQNHLVVLFADITRHGKEMEEILDAAFSPLAQRHPGLRTDTRSMFRCGLFLFRTERLAISAILFIAPDEARSTAAFCISFATLETAGFRGRVTSLSQETCKSPRCANRASTMFQGWDFIALSALYSVEDPKPITALYRFKELFKAAPRSFQSPD